MLAMFGSLDLASLVPSGYRAYTSLVLQTTLSAFFIYVVFKVVAFIRYRLKVERMFGNLPGPSQRHWLRGSFKEMPDDPQDRLMLFVKWCNMYSAEKGFMRIWGPFGNPMLVACHPISMKKILKTAEPKPKDIASAYRTAQDWLGDGLLISAGDKWVRNRRLLTPAFHSDILKPYINVYNDSSNVFKRNLEVFADSGEKFELFQNVCKCTLDIILRCAFSYETDVQRSGEAHPYVVAVTDLAVTNSYRSSFQNLAPWIWRSTLPCLPHQPIAFDFVLYHAFRNQLLVYDMATTPSVRLSKMGQKFKRDCEFVHSVAEDIINRRRSALAKTGSVGDRKYIDFLDILLTARDESGNGMSDLDIRNEVDTFLFGGHDTTASAMSWILYSLAKHPEYQQKCHEEIDAILEGRDTDDIEWADLQKFKYLTMCIKEGMRLYCPVAIVGRIITKDFELGGQVYPPGTSVMFNIWMLHHNEHVWGKDHMVFKPDRFTKENVAKMDPYQNCIGQNFAMNEEKVVLAKLLYNFKFKLVPDHEVRIRLAAVMRAQNGIMMTVERRRH